MKTLEVLVNRKAHYVKVFERCKNSLFVEVNGKNVEVKLAGLIENKVFLEVNGNRIQAELVRTSGNALHIKISGKIFEVQYPTPPIKEKTVKVEPPTMLYRKPVERVAVGKDAVLAPISGRIVDLKVDVGQKVSKGDCICILEAMKMANEVAAPKDGVVKEILVSNGAIVNKGDILAVIA